jgi:hypothetical protein
MVRITLFVLGILLMAGGAVMGLVVGQAVHADVAGMKLATVRGDVTGYNAAVDAYNADVQTRSLSFGVVIFGALFIAATAAYDVVSRRRATE